MFLSEGSYRSIPLVKVLAGAVLLVGAVLAGMAFGVFGPKALSNSDLPVSARSHPGEGEASGQGPFSRYTVATDAGKLVLGQGEYLVALLSMSCEHCMASVPQLNEFVDVIPDIPIVALCWEPTEGALEEFAALSGPLFPMHSLGDNFMEFAALIGNAPPRLSYVRDGVALYSWDDTMPALEAVAAAIESSRVPAPKTGPG